ncbi:META domain-containing protein [Synechococcus sp. Tobar12-5m-g]|uniref:META domain-containing protein n=1 Tax=unclassified Synechococcus TaxID=2626047 RepID=UPI0020CF56C5|nr:MULTISPECIES: META domain-containing protein [unclassified Synechococcus]MCP9773395.1 META domain-containing protein [Synechococcus sp. Tobar12-5m-g]MCP9874236.1 META domain-containing protein [Synechococcus sp. Cruz CV-v-12]
MLFPLRFVVEPAGLAASLVMLAAPAMAGTLSGTATYRERIALPPDAVFEVVPEDISLADAPFRFSITDPDRTMTSRSRYTVRATVRDRGQQLLFSTDRITPVFDGRNRPVELLMVKVGGGGSAAGASRSAALGALPASWQGDIPAAGGATRWHLDLAPDGTYQLRQTFLDRLPRNRFDDIGRWRLDTPTKRLELRGGREAPLFLQPIDGGATLRKLDRTSKPIDSRHNDRLYRLAKAAPIDPRLHLQGMFTYLADAATIRLCANGQRLPVAMEKDYLALERAYLKARPADKPGQPLLVHLDGLITQRPSIEAGQPPGRTLVVEKFVNVLPGKVCPPTATAQSPGLPISPLRGTRWRLLRLGDQTVPSDGPSGRGAELLLEPDQPRFSGSGGCNRLMGAVQLEGESLRFGKVAATMMACPDETMEFGRRFTAALEKVRRWSIDKHSLLLQDAAGKTLWSFKQARKTELSFSLQSSLPAAAATPTMLLQA